MRCSACGADNPAGAKFCSGCGTSLAAVCARCGHANAAGRRFCNECGAAFESEAASQASPPSPERYTPRHLAEKILASRAGLERERKQVTVLFADVVGSTELVRDRDTEDAQRLLDGAVERKMSAVHRYEGTVSRLTGDGLMAMFGAPVAHEDHAVRACFAALAMLDAIRRYAEEARRAHGVEVEIRVGINSGEVIVRLISDDLHMDYTALGQTVHLAARMEGLANAGTALLTPATRALVEGVVDVRPLGPTPVKGLEHPLDVYELVGVGAARTRLQVAATRGLTPLVGRHDERTAIHRALDRTTGGHGQVVALVGEPGVGKSRLVYEVTDAASGAGWRVLASGAVSYGFSTPYLPLVDLLKSYCRIEAGDDSETMRERLTSRVLSFDRALEPILAPLLALLGLPVDDPAWSALDPPRRRRATLDAVRQLLHRESRERPLLLVVEDLHWIDSETQVLLDNLVESLPTARILLLVNYRPEYSHGWGNKSYYTQVRVGPLAEGSADELLQSLLGDDEALASLKRNLVEHTGGNPFFLEESVRSLVEIGALIGRRGAYTLARDLPSVSVPPTVQAMLAARIDRLDPEAKRLLQTAAVIGRDVPFDLLHAVAPYSDAELQATLARLQSAELLYPVSLFPDLEYTFTHALTYDVAYGSVLLEQRRALHAAIVEAIEGLYRERLSEQVKRLAEHAFRGEIWEKAMLYARQAGRKTQALAAHREAAAHFARALVAQRSAGGSAGTPEQLRSAIDLRLEMRTSLIPLGDLRRVHEVLREAEDDARALGDHLRLGHIHNYLTSYHLRDGQPLRAVGYARQALRAAVDLDDFGLRASARFHLGLALHDLGELRSSVDVFRENVAVLVGDLRYGLYGLAGLPASMSQAQLAMLFAELGQFAEARVAAEEAFRIAEVGRNAWSMVGACFSVGTLFLLAGETREAIDILERGVGLCETHDFPLQYPSMASRLGHAYMLAGEKGRGLRLLDEAARRGDIMVHAAEGPRRLTWQADAHLRVGETDRALELARQAVEQAASSQRRLQEAHALRVLGEVLAHRDRPDRDLAEERYGRALALAEKLGMRPLQAHCHLGLGKLCRSMDRQADARAELSTAITMLRDMGMAFWLPEAQAELAATTPPPSSERVG